MADIGGGGQAGGGANQGGPANLNRILGGPLPEGAAINLFEEIARDNDLMAIVARMRAGFGLHDDDVQIGGDITTGDYTVEDMKIVMLESVNGDRAMPEQRVRVGFLRADQKMIIPMALGLHPYEAYAGGRIVPYEPTLGPRYHRAGMLTYEQIRGYVNGSTPFTDIRQTVEAQVPVANQLQGFNNRWNTDEFYVHHGNQRDSIAVQNTAFAYLSAALGFNCDIRDTGFLLRDDARCADGSWLRMREYTEERIGSKLKPFSLISIAALNYSPTGDSALGGWIRSYGLSTGLLPDADSICLKEYRFTLSQPTQQLRIQISNYKRQHEATLHPLCMNILAMFGLLHLNKEHTYRPTGSNMYRICKPYIETLRTLVNEYNTEFLQQQMEVVCRTGPHPFGLSQTYFLARMMHRYSFLTPPLMIRYNVAPPPVQRFLIVQSVIGQWSVLPAGRKLNESFKKLIDVIDREVAKIRSSPPSFSELHRYYGIDQMYSPEKKAWRAVEALMPCVYGFSTVLHGEREDRSIARAVSLKNVERDAKPIAMMFVALWEQCLTTTESAGLVNYAVSSTKLLAGGEFDEEEGIERSRSMRPRSYIRGVDDM